jgi:hypothetical protein
VTEAIRQDMQGYVGYLNHVIVKDQDDPGHLIVLSEWQSRHVADEVLAAYADSENAKRANDLVTEPRKRTVGRAIGRGDVDSLARRSLLTSRRSS